MTELLHIHDLKAQAKAPRTCDFCRCQSISTGDSYTVHEWKVGGKVVRVKVCDEHEKAMRGDRTI